MGGARVGQHFLRGKTGCGRNRLAGKHEAIKIIHKSIRLDRVDGPATGDYMRHAGVLKSTGDAIEAARPAFAGVGAAGGENGQLEIGELEIAHLVGVKKNGGAVLLGSALQH